MFLQLVDPTVDFFLVVQNDCGYHRCGRGDDRVHCHRHRTEAEGQHHANHTGDAEITDMLKALAVGHDGHGHDTDQKHGKRPFRDFLCQYRGNTAKQAYQGKGADAGNSLAGFLFPGIPSPLQANDGAKQKRNGEVESGLVSGQKLGSKIIHGRA